MRSTVKDRATKILTCTACRISKVIKLSYWNSFSTSNRMLKREKLFSASDSTTKRLSKWATLLATTAFRLRNSRQNAKWNFSTESRLEKCPSFLFTYQGTPCMHTRRFRRPGWRRHRCRPYSVDSKAFARDVSTLSTAPVDFAIAVLWGRCRY